MPGSTTDLRQLEDALGYRFGDRALLREALTHGSATAPGSKRMSYQRLEFLGDRVLGVVVADMLFTAFPDDDEGAMARRFNAMVRRETCAKIARKLGLGRFLILGQSEVSSGGRRKGAILADTCESVIGAVYRDGGMEAARAVIEANWSEMMALAGRPARDAKTTLQEWAQGRGLGLPAYELSERSGPDHAPDFTVTVTVSGLAPATGRGATKRDAEQRAATAQLVALGVWQAERLDDV